MLFRLTLLWTQQSSIIQNDVVVLHLQLPVDSWIQIQMVIAFQPRVGVFGCKGSGQHLFVCLSCMQLCISTLPVQ